jgi:hypothetical protein
MRRLVGTLPETIGLGIAISDILKKEGYVLFRGVRCVVGFDIERCEYMFYEYETPRKESHLSLKERFL